MKLVFPPELQPRYVPVRKLGEGGFGVVLLARDSELRRVVAIKLLHVHHGAQEQIQKRFVRESQALAGLEHPGVVRLFDAGETSAGRYMVTEYLEGEELGSPLPPEEAWDHLRQVAEALATVHERGILHRDLKPANVMVTATRTVLIDFGLVQAPEHTALTRTNHVVGTVRYLAPELLAGEPASEASDWYAWGATLFACRAGRPPRDVRQVMAAASCQNWPPIEIPEALADDPLLRLALRYLEPDPARRATGVPVSPLAPAPAPRPAIQSRAPRPPPPSVAAPRVELRRSLGIPWIAAGLLLGLGLGLVVLGRSATAPAAGPATETRAATEPPVEPTEDPGPFGARLEARLVQELQDAALLWIDEDDATGSYGREAPPAGARPLVSPDPVLWPWLLRELPELNRVGRWFVEGRRWEDLPEATKGALRAVDEAYRGQDLDPPFDDLMVEPAPEGPWPPRIREMLLEVLPESSRGNVPELARGFLRAALLDLEEQQLAYDQLDRDVAAGVGPRLAWLEGDDLPLLRIGGELPDSSTRGILSSIREVAARRPIYFRRTRDLRRRTRRGYAALARSLSDEPESRDLVVMVSTLCSNAVAHWGVGLDHWPVGDPLLGKPPGGPHGDALRAIVLVEQEFSWIGRPVPEEVSRARHEAFLRFLEAPPPSDELGRVLAAEVASTYVGRLGRLTDLAAARHQVSEFLGPLVEQAPAYPPYQRAWAARSLVQLVGPAPLAEHSRTLEGFLRDALGEPQTTGTRAKFEETLRLLARAR